MADRDGVGDADTPHLPDADLYPDAVTRASRIACLLLGSDESSPNAFAELEPFAALRFDASACRQTYLTLDNSMEEIFGDAEDFSDAPVARVRVQHDPAAPALSEARDFLIASGILMGLRDDLIEYVGLPVDVLLRGASCGSGSPGFMYNPTRKEIIACYEEVDWFLFGEPAAQMPGRSGRRRQFGFASEGHFTTTTAASSPAARRIGLTGAAVLRTHPDRGSSTTSRAKRPTRFLPS
jgi:hypothetical protein